MPACLDAPPAGRLSNPSAFQQRVLYGGCEPEARPEVWKLLLGVHAPGATRAERQAEASRRRLRYQVGWDFGRHRPLLVTLEPGADTCTAHTACQLFRTAALPAAVAGH